MIQIKPKVGDLVRVKDPIFDDDTILFGYCIESEKEFFTLNYFEDDSQYCYYWFRDEYDLEMSIISTGQQTQQTRRIRIPNDFRGLEKTKLIQPVGKSFNEINKF